MVRRLAIAVAALVAVSLVPAASSAAVTGKQRARAVKWAVEHTGMREAGTTNCGPQISRWQRQMGLRLPPCRPWCGAFLHQAYLRAGVRLSARLIDPDRSYDDAIKGRRGLRRIDVEDVRKGDLLFFAFRQGLRASHFAIARGRPRDGRVSTAEGNVGHRSVLASRNLGIVVLAARVTG